MVFNPSQRGKPVLTVIPGEKPLNFLLRVSIELRDM